MIKTSTSHPLRIDAVEIHGTAGLVGMTLCPGKVQKDGLSGHWERDLDLDLAAIRDWGATVVVSLMQPYEFKAFKVERMAERIPAGISHLVLPIPDGGTPDGDWERQWADVGPGLRSRLRSGERILVHCRGGLGRTGTLAARILVEFGMPPEQAVEAVRKARPGAIETAQQERYVRGLKPAQAFQRRPYHRIHPEQASRTRGCLLAGAAGDALGAAVEFMDLDAIRARFGAEGIRDFAPAYGRLGAITDDTQMTLFTAEGVLRAHVRGRMRGLSTISGVVAHAYQRWLLTQGVKGLAKEVARDGWLLTHRELFSPRAPGNTCLSALQARDDFSDAAPARNHSKGCGGVMRAAPVGLYAAAQGGIPGEQAFTWGCEVAALTHGHPTGQLPAGVHAMLVCDLARGSDLPTALEAAKAVLRQQADHEETLRAIESAERLASGSKPSGEAIATLGQGWVAEEALAIALFAALRAGTLEEGIVTAVNITGDSDSTGAIAGNLLGAMLGVHEIPERWLQQLELREVITEMADDLATASAWAVHEHLNTEEEPEQAYWCERYPGW